MSALTLLQYDEPLILYSSEEPPDFDAVATLLRFTPTGKLNDHWLPLVRLPLTLRYASFIVDLSKLPNPKVSAHIFQMSFSRISMFFLYFCLFFEFMRLIICKYTCRTVTLTATAVGAMRMVVTIYLMYTKTSARLPDWTGDAIWMKDARQLLILILK
jgi:hypothetical protein